MTAIPFDTLKLAKKSEATGFTQQQAAGAAEALADAMDGAQILTKSDLRELELKLCTQMLELENRMNTRLMTLLAGQTALIIGAVFAIIKGL